MAYQNIKIEINDGIAVLTLNRPEVRNALDYVTWDEIRAGMRELRFNDDAHVIILTGAGGKAFASGADIKALNARTVSEQMNSEVNDILYEITMHKKPVIAAVDGYALGGGCELAMACDFRVAGKSAVFGQPEVGLGILPGAGGTQRLALLAGPAVAREMVLLGRQLRADEALTCGLVTKVVENEATLDTALALAAELCKKPAYALAQAKCAIVTGQNFGVGCGKLFERQLFALTFSNSDQVEGMHAFLERREPCFQNQR